MEWVGVCMDMRAERGVCVFNGEFYVGCADTRSVNGLRVGMCICTTWE
jgi:hypothetical protein